MKKLSVLGTAVSAIGFVGSCLFVEKVVKDNILAPSPQTEQMAFMASIFILVILTGLIISSHFVKKTDS